MRKIWKSIRFIYNFRSFFPFIFEFFLSKEVNRKKKLFSIAFIIGYFLLPFDAIPDFLSLIGIVDDVVIFTFIMQQMIKMAPKELQEKYCLA